MEEIILLHLHKWVVCIKVKKDGYWYWLYSILRYKKLSDFEPIVTVLFLIVGLFSTLFLSMMIMKLNGIVGTIFMAIILPLILTYSIFRLNKWIDR